MDPASEARDWAQLAGFVTSASIAGFLLFGLGYSILGPWAVEHGYGDESRMVIEQVRQFIPWAQL